MDEAVPPSADSEHLTVRRGVLLRQLRRDPAALGNGQPLAASPLANARSIARPAAAATATAAATTRRRQRTATAHPASDADEAGQALAQLPGMAVAEVDLVRRAVQRELQRLRRRSLVAVQIAHQHYLNPLRHFRYPL